MHNIRPIHQFVFDLTLTIEYYNLICHEHLGTPNSDGTQSNWYYPIFPFIKRNHHAKNLCNSSILSGDVANLRILQTDWLRAFWAISRSQNFDKLTNFLTKNKIFQKPWKTLFLGHFGPIIPVFGPLIFFFKNPAITPPSYWFLPIYQTSEKSNDGILRKCLDWQMDGHTGLIL